MADGCCVEREPCCCVASEVMEFADVVENDAVCEEDTPDGSFVVDVELLDDRELPASGCTNDPITKSLERSRDK